MLKYRHNSHSFAKSWWKMFLIYKLSWLCPREKILHMQAVKKVRHSYVSCKLFKLPKFWASKLLVGTEGTPTAQSLYKSARDIRDINIFPLWLCTWVWDIRGRNSPMLCCHTKYIKQKSSKESIKLLTVKVKRSLKNTTIARVFKKPL